MNQQQATVLTVTHAELRHRLQRLTTAGQGYSLLHLHLTGWPTTPTLDAIATRLTALLRAADGAGRLATVGDDQVIVLLDACTTGEAVTIARLLRSRLQNAQNDEELGLLPTHVSIGLLSQPDPSNSSVDTVLAAACQAAKSQGRASRIVVAQPPPPEITAGGRRAEPDS